MSARFSSTGLPETSEPSGTTREWEPARASGDERMSPRVTTCRLWFGTSMPIALRPGIGARKRNSPEASAYLISLASDRTLLTLTPGPSSTSKRVTVGPALCPLTDASTLNSSKVASSTLVI